MNIMMVGAVPAMGACLHALVYVYNILIFYKCMFCSLARAWVPKHPTG